MWYSFIRQTHSWSRLLVSEDLLRELYRGCKVNSQVLAHWACFGWKKEDTDIGGPQTWYSPVFDEEAVSSGHRGERYSAFASLQVLWLCHIRFVPAHILTHKQLGCGYVLKYIELARHPKPYGIWAERQTSVSYFGQTDAWILVSPSVQMQLKLDAITSDKSTERREMSFSLHLGFLNAATANWKPYMAYLTLETNKQARPHHPRTPMKC
jgi:hypothetical protein